MSAGENIRVVQAAFEAYFRGDEPGMLELMDPELVVTQFPEQVDARPYHGHEGVREVMAAWTGTWDDYSIELVDMREIGEHVLVSIRQTGRGKRSGIEMRGEAYMVFTLRAGRVIRWQMFSTEAEALEAAAPA